MASHTFINIPPAMPQSYPGVGPAQPPVDYGDAEVERCTFYVAP